MVYRWKRKNKRFPDTWYVSWYDHGRKKHKRIGPSKAAAEAFKRDVEEELSYRRAGREPPGKEVSLKDAIDKYLEYSKANKASRTFVVDEYALRKLLFPFLQKKNINDIRDIYPDILEDLKSYRLSQVAKVTHNREITSIKAFFNMMVQWGYLRENPAKHLKKLRLPVQVPRFLAKDEIEKLLAAADKDIRPIVEIFLYTGLRRNELRFLRWQDIDMKNKRILVQNKEGFHTKSYQPRTIPMHHHLFKLFKNLEKGEKGQYIFPSPSGGSRTRLNQQLNKAIKKAKLEGVALHTLRHTFASHLGMAGVPMRTIQSLMGHADIKTTMIYAHLSPEHLRGAIDKLSF